MTSSDHMDGSCFENSIDLLSFFQDQILQGLIRDIGHQRETAIEFDLLKKPHGDDLFDFPPEHIAGGGRLTGTLYRKGHILRPDTENHVAAGSEGSHGLDRLS